MSVKRDRAALLVYLRVAFGVILLLFLFSLVDFEQLALTLSAVKPHFVLASFAVMLLNYCLKTYRWAAILRVQRPDLSLAQIARLNFVSIYFRSFLSSNFSSDIVII